MLTLITILSRFMQATKHNEMVCEVNGSLLLNLVQARFHPDVLDLLNKCAT